MIDFEIIIEKLGKLKGTGKCILTTVRICLINGLSDDSLKGFDLPLALTY